MALPGVQVKSKPARNVILDMFLSWFGGGHWKSFGGQSPNLTLLVKTSPDKTSSPDLYRDTNV
jgi:hypothetical protein